MISLLSILVLLYLLFAFCFFLYMFLRQGPKQSVKLVKELFSDINFVTNTSRIWRNLILAQIKAETIPLIISGITAEISETLTLDPETVKDLKKQLSHAVLEQWNLWFGRQTQAVKRMENEEMKDSKEVAQYITMNADRPDAIAAISTAISAKSPVLGAALQYLSQQQQGAGKGGQAVNYKGRY